MLGSAELSDLHKTYTSSKCYNFALRYLALRPRSIKEVQDYLRRKDFKEDDINSVIVKLSKNNYLNDQDFALLWVQNRMRLNPKSITILRAELLKKGISKDIASSVLSTISQTDQLESVIKIIQSKAHQSRYQQKQKMIEYLARKGYNYGLIKEALDSVSFYQE